MATTDALLTQVRARCFWPATNAPLTSTELLSFADAEILGSLWPDILAAQGDYYTAALDYDITVDVSRYRLPKRAYGPIKDVLFIPANGTEADAQSVPLVNLEQLGHQPVNRGGTSSYVSFIDGDFLGLSPIPNATQGTLRIVYYRAPSTLCLVASALQITSVTAATGRLSFATDPDTLYNVGTEIDVISAGNAHQVLVDETAIASFPNSTTLAFADDLEGVGVQADDWTAPAGQTPLVQVPDSMIPLLSYRTALAALASAGDREGFKACLAWGQESQLERKQIKLLEPRSESEPRSIDTRYSTLWVGRGRQRAWR